ncbi:MAG: PadR family transcriptional regulator [Thermoplasmataceae archaeon]|jgi:DNA-binding PadR family transcriptional regulator
MIRENATKILILLSFENLTLYKISKYLAKFNGPQSNGTISPILKNLVSEGYIKFSRLGPRKVYSLTEKGKQYVSTLQSLNEVLREKIFSDSIAEKFLYLDLFSNLEDGNILRDTLESISGELLAILWLAFTFKKDGHEGKLSELTRKLSAVREELLQYQ